MATDNQTIEGGSFYAICPSCGAVISFQGADIQYYKPIGTELNNELYDKQEEVMDTGKNVACPYCETVSKASDCTFVTTLN